MPVAGDCHLRLAAGGSSCGSMASRAPNGRAGEGRLPNISRSRPGTAGAALRRGTRARHPKAARQCGTD